MAKIADSWLTTTMLGPGSRKAMVGPQLSSATMRRLIDSFRATAEVEVKEDGKAMLASSRRRPGRAKTIIRRRLAWGAWQAPGGGRIQARGGP